MTLIKLSGEAYDFGRRIFSEEPMTPAPGYSTSVAIVEGKSSKEIGKILEEKGLIRSGTLFYFQEMVSDYHGKLLPGVYQLSTSMTPEEMMAIMAEGYDELAAMQEANSVSSSNAESQEDYEDSIYGGEYSQDDIEFNTESNTGYEEGEDDGAGEDASQDNTEEPENTED